MRCEATLWALGQDLEEGRKASGSLGPCRAQLEWEGAWHPCAHFCSFPPGSLGGLVAMARTPAPLVCQGVPYTVGMASWG